MLIRIIETDSCEGTEVIIKCQKKTDKILRIQEWIKALNKKLTGIKDNNTYILDVSDIFYIDTVDRKTFLYTIDSVYETSLKLYELELLLGDNDYYRIGKSTIINFNQIRKILPDFGGKLQAELNNGERLSVSRQYATKIKEKLGALK